MPRAFGHLDESEHVAGTRIAMVKAMIRQGMPDPNRALDLLTQADRALESLGALEGIAQASLLRAQVNASCARVEVDAVKRAQFITDAEAASSRAKAVFQSITTRQYGNDLDVIEGELFRLRQNCIV